MNSDSSKQRIAYLEHGQGHRTIWLVGSSLTEKERASSSWHLRIVSLIISWVLFCPSILLAKTPLQSTSSRAARDEAIKAVPAEQLGQEIIAKIRPVVTNPSLFRRIPAAPIECDPEMHVFLTRYPEVVVNIWDLMGITKVSVDRTGPYTFRASDGQGTVTHVELLYRTPELQIVYADGVYEGPLCHKPLGGQCVLLLRSKFHADKHGRTTAVNVLDVFVRVDHAGVDLLTKMLHPLVARTADFNFRESAKFLGRISRAASENGPGVQRLATRLTKVEPPVRDEFAKVALRISSAKKVDRTLEIARQETFVGNSNVKQLGSETQGQPTLRGTNPVGKAMSIRR